MVFNNINKKGLNFEHIISLGHACAVAHELENHGYRDASGPFDWQSSTSLEDRIKLINSNFELFFDCLRPDCLYQRQVPSVYLMKSCSTYLVHDFTEWKPLDVQLPDVIEKYKRRVKAFYNHIKEPSLFIYYLYGDDDVNYINNNYDFIISSLKKYNENNEIIFIADEQYKIKFDCFYVKNDPGSDISYDFTKNSQELSHLFEILPYSNEKRERNLKIFNDKQFSKKINNQIKKVKKWWYSFSGKQHYHHTLTYFE